MSWKAHMDGTHGGEEHLLYMERRRTIVIHACLLFFFGMFRICFLSLFSRVAVLFSKRVFMVGNPYLILTEGEVLWATFPHSGILPKLPPSVTTLFL